MGTAAYSIHCWLITRLYVFYHKRYGIDDTHRLTLLLRILYGFPCATRFAVPYCNNVISLVHHITIALVHTIRRITLLQKRFFVAFGGYIKVPIPESLAPFLSLCFAREGTLKRNAIISRFPKPRTISAANISTPIAIPVIKCVTPFSSICLIISSLSFCLSAIHLSSAS